MVILKLFFFLIVVLAEISNARKIYRLARIVYGKQFVNQAVSQPNLCELQNQVRQILQQVQPEQQSLVDDTISSIGLTLRQDLVDTIESSVDTDTLKAFRTLELGSYKNLLRILGLVEDNTHLIQVDRSTKSFNNDVCLLQIQLINEFQSTRPQTQQTLLKIYSQLNDAFKSQMPRILQEIYAQNRLNIGQIFQNNPDVFNQFRQLFGNFFAGGLISLFG